LVDISWGNTFIERTTIILVLADIAFLQVIYKDSKEA
jgi:hypothetical protein